MSARAPPLPPPASGVRLGPPLGASRRSGRRGHCLRPSLLDLVTQGPQEEHVIAIDLRHGALRPHGA
eukprot:3279184-Alexandrium_andersonii.AAC.1